MSTPGVVRSLTADTELSSSRGMTGLSDAVHHDGTGGSCRHTDCQKTDTKVQSRKDFGLIYPESVWHHDSAPEKYQFGQVIPDHEDEGAVQFELIWSRYAIHHDGTGGSRRLTAFLVDFNEGLLP